MSSNDFEGSFFFALKFILLIKKSTDHTALKKKKTSLQIFLWKTIIEKPRAG